MIKEHQAPYDFFRYTKYGLMETVKGSGMDIKSINGIGGTNNIILTQISIYKTQIYKLSFIRRFIALFFIKIMWFVTVLLRKFAGDLTHPDCPQGYVLVLKKI